MQSNSYNDINDILGFQEFGSVKKAREDLRKIVDIFRNQSYAREQLELYGKLRKLSSEILDKDEAFMVIEEENVMTLPEELRHPSLGFAIGNHLVYQGRFVFPIKDVDGSIAGFVGHDATVQPKYLDSKNFGYKANTVFFAGMEQLKENYVNDDLAIFVEGKICQLWLREQGFFAYASLGSFVSKYMTEIMRRFGRRAVCIYDNDKAGRSRSDILRKELKYARILQPKLASDVDDTRLLEGADKDEIVSDIRNLVRNPFSPSRYFQVLR